MESLNVLFAKPGKVPKILEDIQLSGSTTETRPAKNPRASEREPRKEVSDRCTAGFEKWIGEGQLDAIKERILDLSRPRAFNIPS
jgi:hypothetical protein